MSERASGAPEAKWRRRDRRAPPTNNKRQRRPAAAASALVRTSFGEPPSDCSTMATCRCRSSRAEKRPAFARWSTVPIDVPTVERWTEQYPACGIGLRTGTLVGVDIDILDPDLAHRVDHLVRQRLGDTLMRVGLWPKRLLPYRTEAPLDEDHLRNLEGEKVEFLGLGQQFVAFGIHPDTGQPYHWVGDTPLDVPLDALPCVTRDQLLALKVEIEALLPSASPPGRGSPQRRVGSTEPDCPVRDDRGLIVDGRDGWLSSDRLPCRPRRDRRGRRAPRGRRSRRDRLAAVRSERRARAPRIARRALLDHRRETEGRRQAAASGQRAIAAPRRADGRGRLPGAGPLGCRSPATTRCCSASCMPQVRGLACRPGGARLHGSASRPPSVSARAPVARRQLLAMRARLIAAGLPSRLLILVPSHAPGRGSRRRLARRRRPGRRAARLRSHRSEHRNVDVPRPRRGQSRHRGAEPGARDLLHHRRSPLRLLCRLPEAAQSSGGGSGRRGDRRASGALHRLRRRGRHRSGPS